MVEQKFRLNPVDPAWPRVPELMHEILVTGREEAQVAQLGLRPLADLVQDTRHRERMCTEFQRLLSAPHHIGNLKAG
jgi:hypothetical protein